MSFLLLTLAQGWSKDFDSLLQSLLLPFQLIHPSKSWEVIISFCYSRPALWDRWLHAYIRQTLSHSYPPWNLRSGVVFSTLRMCFQATTEIFLCQADTSMFGANHRWSSGPSPFSNISFTQCSYIFTPRYRQWREDSRKKPSTLVFVLFHLLESINFFCPAPQTLHKLHRCLGLLNFWQTFQLFCWHGSGKQDIHCNSSARGVFRQQDTKFRIGCTERCYWRLATLRAQPWAWTCTWLGSTWDRGHFRTCQSWLRWCSNSSHICHRSCRAQPAVSASWDKLRHSRLWLKLIFRSCQWNGWLIFWTWWTRTKYCRRGILLWRICARSPPRCWRRSSQWPWRIRAGRLYTNLKCLCTQTNWSNGPRTGSSRTWIGGWSWRTCCRSRCWRSVIFCYFSFCIFGSCRGCWSPPRSRFS